MLLISAIMIREPTYYFPNIFIPVQRLGFHTGWPQSGPSTKIARLHRLFSITKSQIFW